MGKNEKYKHSGVNIFVWKILLAYALISMQSEFLLPFNLFLSFVRWIYYYLLIIPYEWILNEWKNELTFKKMYNYFSFDCYNFSVQFYKLTLYVLSRMN